MSGEIDTSAGGSLKERMAKLRLSQEQSGNNIQEIPITNGKYRPILPSNTEGYVTYHGNSNSPTPKRRPPPPPPQCSPPNATPPLLPARKTSSDGPTSSPRLLLTVPSPNQANRAPQLPVRRQSSSSSLASISSLGSIKNGIRPLPPPYMGKESLPVQFPEKGLKDERVQQLPTRVNSSYAKVVIPPHNGVLETKLETMKIVPPNLPPRLPSRRPTSRGEHNKAVNLGAVGTDNGNGVEQNKQYQLGQQDVNRRRLPPPPSEAPVIEKKVISPPQPPNRPSPTRDASQSPPPPVPPPIPIASRPATLPLSTRPKIQSNGTDTTNGSCLPCFKCYDFSAPDTLAASSHLERTVVPSIAHLAHELTSPFDTVIEKARAIFTWMHHNISYDVYSFFNSCVKGQSSMETLRKGSAVCSGYAGLFEEIVMAGVGFNHSGGRNKPPVLTINGFGKGYGYNSPTRNSPLPELSSNHAWNAILLENGTYHLLDCCWGAGNVTGPEPGWPNGRFNKAFNEESFIAEPEEFGKKHFPMKSEYQFRMDGKIIDFEEFIRGERGDPFRGIQLVKTYTCIGKSGFGFDEHSISPRQKYFDQGPNIYNSNNKTIRFSLSKPCPHVRIIEENEGIYFITIEGVKDPVFPLVRRGVTWFVDVDVSRLKDDNGRMVDLNRGGSGKDGRRVVWLCHVMKVDGRDSKGMRVEEWLRLRGKVGMSWGYMAEWNGIGE